RVAVGGAEVGAVPHAGGAVDRAAIEPEAVGVALARQPEHARKAGDRRRRGGGRVGDRVEGERSLADPGPGRAHAVHGRAQAGAEIGRLLGGRLEDADGVLVARAVGRGPAGVAAVRVGALAIALVAPGDAGEGPLVAV